LTILSLKIIIFYYVQTLLILERRERNGHSDT